MSKVNDGGPAFPVGAETKANAEAVIAAGHGGLSVRDYFAAKAMQGVMSGQQQQVVTIGTIAHSKMVEAMTARALGAYAMADAMLAAREAK